jgi:hypothetical protein
MSSSVASNAYTHLNREHQLEEFYKYGQNFISENPGMIDLTEGDFLRVWRRYKQDKGIENIGSATAIGAALPAAGSRIIEGKEYFPIERADMAEFAEPGGEPINSPQQIAVSVLGSTLLNYLPGLTRIAVIDLPYYFYRLITTSGTVASYIPIIGKYLSRIIYFEGLAVGFTVFKNIVEIAGTYYEQGTAVASVISSLVGYVCYYLAMFGRLAIFNLLRLLSTPLKYLLIRILSMFVKSTIASTIAMPGIRLVTSPIIGILSRLFGRGAFNPNVWNAIGTINVGVLRLVSGLTCAFLIFALGKMILEEGGFFPIDVNNLDLNQILNQEQIAELQNAAAEAVAVGQNVQFPNQVNVNQAPPEAGLDLGPPSPASSVDQNVLDRGAPLTPALSPLDINTTRNVEGKESKDDVSLNEGLRRSAMETEEEARARRLDALRQAQLEADMEGSEQRTELGSENKSMERFESIFNSYNRGADEKTKLTMVKDIYKSLTDAILQEGVRPLYFALTRNAGDMNMYNFITDMANDNLLSNEMMKRFNVVIPSIVIAMANRDGGIEFTNRVQQWFNNTVMMLQNNKTVRGQSEALTRWLGENYPNYDNNNERIEALVVGRRLPRDLIAILQQEGQGLQVTKKTRGKRTKQSIVGGAIESNADDTKPAPSRSKIKIGNMNLNLNDLYKGYLTVRYPSGAPYQKLNRVRVSPKMVEMIDILANKQMINREIYEQLDDKETRLFDELMRISKLNVDEFRKYAALKRLKEGPSFELDQFEKIKAEILAGNNNPNLIKQLKTIVLKLVSDDAIPRAVANKLMYQITLLS